MAQTNLRLTQRTIRDNAAREAKFPIETEWSSDQQTYMTAVMGIAMRKSFQPPALPGEFEPHLWSWLKPITTIDLWPTQSPTSGVTVSVATASATVTITGTSTFYASMIGKTITFYSNDALDTVIGTGIISAVGATTITLTAAAGVGGAGTTYRWGITADGAYRLPVEFNGMDGELYFPPGECQDRIRKVNEDQILTYYQFNDSSGVPTKFAVRPVTDYTGAAEQAWEIIVAPIADAAYAVRYRMHLNVDVISTFDGSTGDKYLPGGSVYSELFRSAALMAVESEVFGTRGLRHAEWMEALKAAVLFDRQHTGADELGEMKGGRQRFRTNSWYDDWNGPDVFVNGDQMFQG